MPQLVVPSLGASLQTKQFKLMFAPAGRRSMKGRCCVRLAAFVPICHAKPGVGTSLRARPQQVAVLAEAASETNTSQNVGQDGRSISTAVSPTQEAPRCAAMPQPGSTEPLPSLTAPWPAIGLATLAAATVWLVASSGMLKTLRSTWHAVSELSEEDTEKWLQEIKTDKMKGKTLAERVQKLQSIMGHDESTRDWSEMKPPVPTDEKMAQHQQGVPESGDKNKYEEMTKALQKMQEERDTGIKRTPLPERHGIVPEEQFRTQSVEHSVDLDLSMRPKQWWERKSALTVVGYRTPMGDVEYMEMDVALEEGERDDRFLAFEDKDDAKTMLAALRAIARSRGIAVPAEDDTTGHFHCLVSPDNIRMLEQKIQKEVLVFRKQELALRIGMDEIELRAEVMKSVFQRPRDSKYKKLKKAPGSVPLVNKHRNSRGSQITPLPIGPEPPVWMAPDQAIGESGPNIPLNNLESQFLELGDGTMVTESSTLPATEKAINASSTTRTRYWWRNLREVWIIQLAYHTGASGIFQCDISIREDETRLSILGFEDVAAVEVVCSLARNWTDLTADAVQAKGTALRPEDLMQLARQMQSDITVLKGSDLRGLNPATTPDDLSDLIMAAIDT